MLLHIHTLARARAREHTQINGAEGQIEFCHFKELLRSITILLAVLDYQYQNNTLTANIEHVIIVPLASSVIASLWFPIHLDLLELIN